MSQTFEYPNLLIGSRSGVGWTYDHGSFDAYNHHCLFNDSKNENYMCSPLFPLKHGITYAFSAFSANTENFMGSDIYVLYAGGYSIGYEWIAGHMGFMKGPGGDGLLIPILSRPLLRKEITIFDSTTMDQQMEKPRSSGSKIRCYALLQNRMHGHRQKGRCGRK